MKRPPISVFTKPWTEPLDALGERMAALGFDDVELAVACHLHVGGPEEIARYAVHWTTHDHDAYVWSDFADALARWTSCARTTLISRLCSTRRAPEPGRPDPLGFERERFETNDTLTGHSTV